MLLLLLLLLGLDAREFTVTDVFRLSRINLAGQLIQDSWLFWIIWPRPFDPRSTDSSTTDPKSTDPGTTDPRSIDPRSTDPWSTNPGSTDPAQLIQGQLIQGQLVQSQLIQGLIRTKTWRRDCNLVGVGYTSDTVCSSFLTSAIFICLTVNHCTTVHCLTVLCDTIRRYIVLPHCVTLYEGTLSYRDNASYLSDRYWLYKAGQPTLYIQVALVWSDAQFHHLQLGGAPVCRHGINDGQL